MLKTYVFKCPKCGHNTLERVETVARAVPVGTKIMIDDLHNTGVVRTLFVDKPTNVYPVDTVQKVQYKCALCSETPTSLAALLKSGALLEENDTESSS